VPLFGHAGLALSVSLGATINAAWLFFGLKRGGWYRPAPGWGRFALKVVFATLALSALLAVAAVNIDWLGLAGREGLRIAWLSGCLAAAALLYFGVLLAAGMRPRDFSRRA
jgi:putative peptidoglycan lipid II flippase